jgi:caffeoyl-CoA O-methyltransferase
MDRSIDLTDDVLDYIARVGVREHPVLAKCRKETAAGQELSIMQISPEQGAYMAMLVKLLGAKRTLEIGVFTGYSSLSVALALPDDGRVTACDVSEAFVGIARGYWEEAGVAHKIDAHVGPAQGTLARLVEQHSGETPYDFAFIDADKTGYDAYYEYALKLLRPGGLIAIDNVLWSGAVADPSNTTENTQALRILNEKISNDERVDIALTPVGDGVFLCRKR